MKENFRKIFVDHPKDGTSDTIFSKFSDYGIAFFNRGALS